MSVLNPWGYVAYAHEPSCNFRKLDPRAKNYMFIRYSKQSKGHVFVGEQEGANVIEFELRDITFVENDWFS